MTAVHHPPDCDSGCGPGCDLNATVELVVERERRRLADALHDTTIQQLSVARILVDFASEQGSDDSLERVKGLLDVSIVQLRSLLWELTPAMLDQGDLHAAIKELGEQLCALWRLSYCCSVVGEATATLPNELVETLFQGARELMTNAGRHARARTCEVVVAIEDTGVSLTVRDDGMGIPPGSKAVCGHGDGYGLFRLRSRVEQLGGELTLNPCDGGGTVASLRLPLVAQRSGDRDGWSASIKTG